MTSLGLLRGAFGREKTAPTVQSCCGGRRPARQLEWGCGKSLGPCSVLSMGETRRPRRARGAPDW
ncbi:hypothetical protein Tb10.6k15.2140 [Trypanosoma brucei brucei TREU927]|uniref:Uncharacterized protein n=1 Tax=Trypanosoma brucei brucei (strain 927/4 GUTat10.1) TaxID=185431 RepID=Q38AC9_TRYB2|nr:hypothetical protein Tb10.6k15.2140 [Trypanosoma brucei brucei TREU927]EAN78241.1 hypothetical protein Tb10.6k15.2140 [Trypanosoma brucei brucei TREU927]